MAKDQASAQDTGWFAISVGIVGNDTAPERWIGLTAFKTWNDDPFVGRQVIRGSDAVRSHDAVRRTTRAGEAVHERAGRQPPRRTRHAQHRVAQLHAVRGQGDAAERRSRKVTAMRALRRPQRGALAMRIRALSVFVLAGLVLPALAPAQAPDFTGTTLVSMKGTLVPDEKTANDVGWGGISFGFTGDAASTTRWFGVVHATAFGGNSFDAKTAVFQAHYNPTLYRRRPARAGEAAPGHPRRHAGAARGRGRAGVEEHHARPGETAPRPVAGGARLRRRARAPGAGARCPGC